MILDEKKKLKRKQKELHFAKLIFPLSRVLLIKKYEILVFMSLNIITIEINSIKNRKIRLLLV